MFKNLIRLGFTFSVAVVTFSSCEHQDFTNELEDVDRVQVNTISDDMAKVRDYVPRMAVIAHRGSTFWVPEETEAAYRWAREMGADYLEADLQCSKDGVVLALQLRADAVQGGSLFVKAQRVVGHLVQRVHRAAAHVQRHILAAGCKRMDQMGFLLW